MEVICPFWEVIWWVKKSGRWVTKEGIELLGQLKRGGNERGYGCLEAVSHHRSLVILRFATDSCTKCGDPTVTKVNGVRVVEDVRGAGQPVQLVLAASSF